MIAQHTKVNNYLMSLIKQGSEGDLLPSQSELCKKFDVSNITVRRALGDIEDKGLIFRKKGKGTFIKECKPVVKNIKKETFKVMIVITLKGKDYRFFLKII